MDEERLEQKLRNYFKAEVQKVEPSPEWWDSAILRLSEHKENRIKTPVRRWLQPASAVIAVIVAAIALVLVPLWSTESPPGALGPTMPPPLSEYIKGYTYTLALLAGVLMMAGLAFRSRFARKIAGFMSIVFGGIGVYLGLEALLSSTKSDQTLIMGIIPVFGIIASIVYIKRKAGRRWMADAGLVLCLLALVLFIIFLVGYHHWFSWFLIAAAIAIPAGVIGYGLHGEIIGFFRQQRGSRPTDRAVQPIGSWESIARQAGIKSRDEEPIHKKSGMAWLAVPLSIFLLVLLVGSLIPMLGGMALPPPEPPSLVSDGSGGAFVFWLDEPSKYGDGIYVQHVDAMGNPLWEEGGKPLTDVPTVLLAAGDGADGAIVAWRDGDGLYVQRLDSAGNSVWTWEEAYPALGLRGITTDGSGGAILLCQDENEQVYAQRISAEGVTLWEEGGTNIGRIQYAYMGMPIVSDGSGGAAIVWEDDSVDGTTLYAQRVSHDGKLAWAEGGVSVTTIISEKERPRLINDGTGSFIIAWTDISIDTGWDEDIYAQKLDADGNPLWGERGILISDAPGQQSDPQIATDGSGGCIIAWPEIQYTGNKKSGIFAQRINSSGEVLWQEGGVLASDIPQDSPVPNLGLIYIIGNGNGGGTVIWVADKDQAGQRTRQVYAQKLGPDGQRLWSEGGVEVYKNPPFRTVGYSSVISDGSGGFIIGSRVSEGSNMSRTDSVYIQRVDLVGSRLWGESGVEIQMKHSSPLLPIIASGVIILTILILFGVFRGNRLAGIFTAIAPVIIGIAALFSNLLLIGPFAYSYGWAYILDTPADLLSVAIIPIAALTIGAVGIWKRAVTKWATIPVVVFCALIAFIVESIIIAGFF